MQDPILHLPGQSFFLNSRRHDDSDRSFRLILSLFNVRDHSFHNIPDKIVEAGLQTLIL